MKITIAFGKLVLSGVVLVLATIVLLPFLLIAGIYYE